VFSPVTDSVRRDRLLAAWRAAVEQAIAGAETARRHE